MSCTFIKGKNERQHTVNLCSVVTAPVCMHGVSTHKESGFKILKGTKKKEEEGLSEKNEALK